MLSSENIRPGTNTSLEWYEILLEHFINFYSLGITRDELMKLPLVSENTPIFLKAYAIFSFRIPSIFIFDIFILPFR